MALNRVSRSLLAAGALLGVLAGTSTSEAFLVSGSSGSLSASANFTLDSGNLKVVLTNTSAADVLNPSQVLTAVFFDIAGVGTLNPVSALLSGGSTVVYGPSNGNVGGEWAYKAGLAGTPNGATEGISSSGLGLFGGANFNGPDLAGPPNGALNGLQYGLLSAGDNTATGNTGVTGSGGLIKNQVTFMLSGLPANFTPSSSNVQNVFFQYGTSLSEPGISVPAPATISLLGVALLGVAAIGRLRSSKRK